jgi:hypothetical protein
MFEVTAAGFGSMSDSVARFTGSENCPVLILLSNDLMSSKGVLSFAPQD